MALILSRSLQTMRRLFVVLLTIGVVARMGATCDAIAASHVTQGAQQVHCAEMPSKPGKPIKAEITACALCVVLPDAPQAMIGTAPPTPMPPTAARVIHMPGLAGGPTPPPPRSA